MSNPTIKFKLNQEETSVLSISLLQDDLVVGLGDVLFNRLFWFSADKNKFTTELNRLVALNQLKLKTHLGQTYTYEVLR